MENVLDFLIFILFGFAGVGVVTIFKTKKENKDILNKVESIDETNQKLNEQIKENLNQTNKKIEELEKEKNVKKTINELVDWFNNRKPDKK